MVMAAGIVESVLKWAVIFAIGFLAGMNVSHHFRVKPLRSEFEAFKNAVNVEGKTQEAKVVYVEREIEREVEIGRKEDEIRIADLERSLGVALNSLRDAASRAKLKDADTAPSECANYAAVPERLSTENAEFLVREAARGDFIAVQRDACIRDYGVAKDRLDALAAEK